ncbi:ATP-binding protein [Spiroplasma turonicum]|uniref:ATPase, AAA family n=1 Tax=Spiroplasma turonicum TaxID=216946 RepID=A0A0K1P6J5_9MOLU|nr:ATP-binding protein [Spiroplasma turonicum]AKU79829.1 ATPase, AAA family [Spiroplasma turonicum]ALX70844.1 ATPase, AAA family [Spiroplasma turonicum]
MNSSIKDIIDLVLLTNSEDAILKLKEYAKHLRSEGKYNDSEYIFNILGSKETVKSSTFNSDCEQLLILEDLFLENEIYNKNNKDITKFVNIILDKVKLRQLGYLKVIIYGMPGTGKTTFVKDLAKLTNRKLYSISAGKLVSSLIGQTQKNMDLLFKDIANNYKKSIFIIDEFDSVIGSRDEIMNKEYHRMIGSFNLMLDKLLPETIIFAITNRLDMIDSATLRRFNVKIFCKSIDMKMFIERLFKLALEKEIPFKKDIVKKMLSIKKSYLNYSNIDDFITDSIFNNTNLEHSIYKILSFDRNEILTSIEFSDKDKAIILNKSYSTIRRQKNEIN